MARGDFSEEDRRILNIRLDAIDQEIGGIAEIAAGNYFMDLLVEAVQEARRAVNGDA